MQVLPLSAKMGLVKQIYQAVKAPYHKMFKLAWEANIITIVSLQDFVLILLIHAKLWIKTKVPAQVVQYLITNLKNAFHRFLLLPKIAVQLQISIFVEVQMSQVVNSHPVLSGQFVHLASNNVKLVNV